MITARKPDAAPDDRALVITRILDAPRQVVFKAWTDRDQLQRWWGPKDFTTTSAEMDVRPGGAYRLCIRSADGVEYWHHGVYREIVKPERLVFTFQWEEEGSYETLITVTFAEHNGKTKLTFEQAVFDTKESRDSHAEGWGECMDNLSAYVRKL